MKRQFVAVNSVNNPKPVIQQISNTKLPEVKRLKAMSISVLFGKSHGLCAFQYSLSAFAKAKPVN